MEIIQSFADSFDVYTCYRIEPWKVGKPMKKQDESLFLKFLQLL